MDGKIVIKMLLFACLRWKNALQNVLFIIYELEKKIKFFAIVVIALQKYIPIIETRIY